MISKKQLKDGIMQAAHLAIKYGLPTGLCCTVITVLMMAGWAYASGQTYFDEDLISYAEDCIENAIKNNATAAVCNNAVLEGAALKDAALQTLVLLATTALPTAVVFIAACCCLGTLAGALRENTWDNESMPRISLNPPASSTTPTNYGSNVPSSSSAPSSYTNPNPA